MEEETLKKLSEEIEKLRNSLYTTVHNNKDDKDILNNDEMLKISQQLDELIVKYLKYK